MRVVIVDGYTDEPAGLGVPPYIDVYPRYIAGAVWSAHNSAEVRYFTVDSVRRNLEGFLKTASRSDLLIFIAGVVVPGKYLGGEPIRFEEIFRWPLLVEGPIKVLCGPAARFGFGTEGGKLAVPPERFEEVFDLVVKGDPEVVVHRLITEGMRVEAVDPYELREGYSQVDEWAIRGAKVVTQHPCFGINLIAEIETYRGCPRWVMGGCSFCVEPHYGMVRFRDQKSIAREVRTLYELGVRCFRLGRQPDILAYKARGVNEEEFPEPDPREIEELFRMVREAAPQAETLHIDNVNPGTVAHHPEASREAAKAIIKYHTPGDVAAMGIESADPEVIKQNRLKVYPDEALEAVRIINSVGSRRGYNGLPELLPGINFVAGLKGESARTYALNFEFLMEILKEGLMVRRVNIRQVLPLPGTPMWTVGTSINERNRRFFHAFKRKVRERFDKPMLERVVPKGTVLRGLYVEGYKGNHSLARQPASYPLLTYIPTRLPLNTRLDVMVVAHGCRSITAVPYPINVNDAPRELLIRVPGLSEKDVRKLLSRRPFRNREELAMALGRCPPPHLEILPHQSLKCPETSTCKG